MNFLTAESVHIASKDVHMEQMAEMEQQFFICKQGAFGGADGGYAYGKVITEIRKGIDEQCPLEDINL